MPWYNLTIDTAKSWLQYKWHLSKEHIKGWFTKIIIISIFLEKISQNMEVCTIFLKDFAWSDFFLEMMKKNIDQPLLFQTAGPRMILFTCGRTPALSSLPTTSLSRGVSSWEPSEVNTVTLWPRQVMCTLYTVHVVFTVYCPGL